MDKEADPRLMLPLQQIKPWLIKQTRQQAMDLVQKAWKMQAAKLSAARVHWVYARGTMGARLCILLDLGWKPTEPLSWTDLEGIVRDIDLTDPVNTSRLVERLSQL